MVPTPRTRTRADAPGCPEEEVTVTPEVRPFRALSILTGATFFKSSEDTLAIEAVTTLFFWVP